MFLFFVGFLIVFLDQFAKNFLLSNQSSAQLVNWKFLKITLVTNTGSAFGLFKNNNTFFIILALITTAIILVIFFKNRRHSLLLRFSLIFILSGALSNLIDRIRFGYVIDYIDVGFWPVFNIADSAISIGIGLLILVLITGKRYASYNF